MGEELRPFLSCQLEQTEHHGSIRWVSRVFADFVPVCLVHKGEVVDGDSEVEVGEIGFEMACIEPDSGVMAVLGIWDLEHFGLTLFKNFIWFLFYHVCVHHPRGTFLVNDIKHFHNLPA